MSTHSGFSLIELLVTVSILAILVGVGVPLYAHYAEQAACRADEAQVTLIWRTASMMAQERGEMPEELRIDPHHPEDMILTAADGEPLTGLASAVADSIGPYVFQSKQYTSLPLGTYLVFDGSELGTEEEEQEPTETAEPVTPTVFIDVQDFFLRIYTEQYVADGQVVEITAVNGRIDNARFMNILDPTLKGKIQALLSEEERVIYKGATDFTVYLSFTNGDKTATCKETYL